MKVKLNGNDFFEVTAQFGATSWIHQTPHTGLDLAMVEGTKLFSPTDGVITKIVDYGSNNIGKGIIIKTDDGESLIMGHLSDTSSVHVGQKIHEGDFLALSGNTGRSTGGHLHLGLKDENGTFINPEKYLNDNHNKTFGEIMRERGRVNNYHNEIIEDKTFIEFLNDWRTDGFWEAMYGKPFFEVCKDFFSELFHDIAIFIVSNGDIFFLLPSIVIMFGTFLVGKNQYSRYILPLWFIYFIAKIINFMI